MTYSIINYEKDAEQLLRIRLAELNERGFGTPIQPVFTEGSFDPAYAAKWSALTRKLKAGFLIGELITFANDYELDMTPTLAMRICKGWVGRSVSNRELIKIFGSENRDASEKSADWPRLDELIDIDKARIMNEYDKCSFLCKEAKERVWKKISKK